MEIRSCVLVLICLAYLSEALAEEHISESIFNCVIDHLCGCEGDTFLMDYDNCWQKLPPKVRLKSQESAQTVIDGIKMEDEISESVEKLCSEDRENQYNSLDKVYWTLVSFEKELSMFDTTANYQINQAKICIMPLMRRCAMFSSDC